ncbi:hypothetical protein SUGI_0838690 [Cryptomeria japonica]|nr:hypothetical protein SUGI_0838690 [Cryptomeria japonica]
MAMATANTFQSLSVSKKCIYHPVNSCSKLFSPHNSPQKSLHFFQKNAFTSLLSFSQNLRKSVYPTLLNPPRAIGTSQSSDAPEQRVFHGECFVVYDNIDTDQIIPAEYLTLVPSKPEEYEKLGSYAFIGLPDDKYKKKFIEKGQAKTKYPIVIAGDNFGCGSSREHAPVALGAAGVKAVLAESYARIFFRNCVATGELYPVETECRVCEECETGHIVTVEIDGNKLINHTTEKEYALKPIGDAGPVIEAGGVFAYARKTGMIASSPSA